MRSCRLVIQIFCLLLPVLVAVLPPTVWLGNYLASHVFTVSLADPLAALEVTLATRELYLPLLWAGLPLLLVSALGGRFFCGWVCPVQTILEHLHFLRRGLGQQSTTPSAPLFRYVPYGVLALCLTASFVLRLPIFTTFSPIGIVVRSLAFGLGAESALFALILATEVLGGHLFWCRMLCPLGALYTLSGGGRRLRVRRDRERCRDCGLCDKACRLGLKVSAGESEKPACLQCLACLPACRAQALRFGFNDKLKD
jgi:ferredoxin-type protein NapH